MKIKDLYPEPKLTKDEEGYLTTITDAELDTVTVRFNYDDCATINTAENEYLMFTVENLQDMIDLINESTELYEKSNEQTT